MKATQEEMELIIEKLFDFEEEDSLKVNSVLLKVDISIFRAILTLEEKDYTKLTRPSFNIMIVFKEYEEVPFLHEVAVPCIFNEKDATKLILRGDTK